MQAGRTPPQRRRALWSAALVLLLLLSVLGACSAGGTPTPDGLGAPPTLTFTPARQVTLTDPQTPTDRAAVTPVPTKTRRASATPTIALSGLPTIQYDHLPPQAQETIVLIQRGGPFPYRQDGVVFQNRERLLPGKPNGYYHEYTVVTPGSSDRGARRIVAGGQGELYYTDDHYASFKQVVMS